MSTPSAVLARGAPREIPQHVSPGLWTLAWRRLKADRVGMVSLAIVVAFLAMMILSGTGLIAKDWAREVGVNYAPPTFVGPDESPLAAPHAGPAVAPEGPSAASDFQSTVVDPIGDVIAELRGDKAAAGGAAPPSARSSSSSSAGRCRDSFRRGTGNRCRSGNRADAGASKPGCDGRSGRRRARASR